MTVTEWGAVFLVLAAVFHWLRILHKTRIILAFLGTCIVSGGLFGSLLTKAVLLVSGLLGTLTGKVFGVTVPGLLVVVLGILFLHDLHPKTGPPAKRTMWVGIALAACLVAGISSFSALNHLPADVRNGTGSATQIGK